MLQICPRIPNQQFDELPFEEAILTFLRELGYSGEIKMITDVNIDKLHQPWRSFAAVINKCLSDFSYLLWEDFVYQIEHKDAKKINEMCYPHFTKVIDNFFMTKDQSIPRRNKVNWHFSRDDHMFTTIKVFSRHQDTQQYGAILPNELTNEAIKNSKSYKEYYAIALGVEPPKTKASVRKKQVSSDTTMHPPTAKADKPVKEKQPAKTSKAKRLTVLSEVALTEAEQMKLATKRILIQTYISHASGSGADEGTGNIPGVPDVPTYASGDDQISWKSSEEDGNEEVNMSKHVDDDVDDQSDDDDNQNDDDEKTNSDNNDDDFVHPKFSTHNNEDKEEESFDPMVQTHSHVENTDDEDNDEDSHGMNVEGDELDDEGENEKDDSNKLYKDVNINLEDTHVIITPFSPEGQQQSSPMSSRFVSNMLKLSPGIDSIFNLNTESTSRVDVTITTTAEPPLLSATTLHPPSTPIITHLQQTPVPSPTNVPSSSLQDLPNFGSLFGFDHRLKALEANFSKFMQTNQFAKAISSIPSIVDKYLDNRMNEAVKTSHAIAANLSELELKKILIDKMERNKSIHISAEQKNLHKALVEAYESDKLILDTYGDTVTIKRRRDDQDEDEEPSAGSNRGSKRRRARKEPESTSAPKEKTSMSTEKSTEGSKSHHKSAPAEKPMHTAEDLKEPTHQEFITGSCKSLVELKYFFEEVYKETTDQLDWNNPEGQQYPHDMRKPLPLIPNSWGHRIIPFDHFINNDLEYLSGGVSSRKESARDVYSKQRIIAVTELQIVKCQNYKHLDWITVCRDDDKLYKFKEGNFNRLRIQDIDDMLLLLVQGKLTNLTVDERLAFNVSLRMFTRSEVVDFSAQRTFIEKCGADIIDNTYATLRILKICSLFMVVILKKKLRVTCYTNVGYETDINDSKSHTIYFFVLNGGVIDWKNAKQSTTTMSSTEAEYIAALEVAMEVVWIRKVIDGLGVVHTNNEPIEMYCNYYGAITISNEPEV
nr:retrotransposon protein, putative, Ty1-copia subclass [Tanacetum cinerariifolium]